MAEERSLSDVLQDILRNVQDMVRFEIRLAKTEIREEVSKTVTPSVWIATGRWCGKRMDFPAVDTGLRTRDQDANVGRHIGHRGRDGCCRDRTDPRWCSKGKTDSAYALPDDGISQGEF